MFTPKANRLISRLPHGHFSSGLYICIRPALAYLLRSRSLIHLLLLGTIIYQFTPEGKKVVIDGIHWRFAFLAILNAVYVRLWASRQYVIGACSPRGGRACQANKGSQHSFLPFLSVLPLRWVTFRRLFVHISSNGKDLSTSTTSSRNSILLRVTWMNSSSIFHFHFTTAGRLSWLYSLHSRHSVLMP